MKTRTIIKKGYGYIHNNRQVALRVGDTIQQDRDGQLFLENGIKIPDFHAKRIIKLLSK